MPVRYRNIKGEFGNSSPFTVFIIHGHSNAWQLVQRHIEENATLPQIFQERP
jgi:hypothetical protein